MLWAVGLVSAGSGLAGVWWTVREVRHGSLGLGELTGVLSLGLSAVGLVVGTISLGVSWLGYRADRREHAGELPIGAIADSLALAVRGQWEAEAQVRRLNDPYPLPVSWVPADQHLVEPWPLLLRMANRTGRRDERVLRPEDLAGADTDITDVFTCRAPGRRLLVLGEPGAGKTMLLVVLVLGLLDRRGPGDPVPVIFPLASWNPRQSLDAWMADRLTADYPALRQLAGDHGRRDGVRALLDNRLILPVLDGLDEVAPSLRSTALAAVNTALPFGRPLVLSSRSTEYGEALNPESGVPQRLNGAPGIVLEPLALDTVAAYLRRDAGGEGTPAADRWDPVLDRMAQRSPLGAVLVTPLALFLARTIYNPRPDEAGPRLPDPAELCDTERFPDETAVRTHLLNAFVPAAYRPHSLSPCPWTPARAEHILRKLALHLEKRRRGSVDIAWWELRYALPSPVLALFTGFALSVLTVALSAVGHAARAYHENNVLADCTPLCNRQLGAWLDGFGLVPYFLVGVLPRAFEGAETEYGGLYPWVPDQSSVLLAGAALLMLCFLVDAVARLGSRFAPTRRLRWTYNSQTLTWTLLCTLFTGLLTGKYNGFLAGLSWSVVALSVCTIITGLTPIPADAHTAATPQALLREDRRSFGQVLLAPVLAGILFLGPGIALGHTAADANTTLEDQAAFLGSGLGFWIGTVIGVALALNRTARGRFTAMRLCLMLLWKAPWNVVAFLDDAHRHRGVLRQVGSVYQYRHVDLQRHLATPPTPPPPGAPASAPCRPPIR
ncbi:hypothetical protein DMH26_00550 [Streptomyces sp. WAC 05379]|uniref:NACHT domain-containing protein n=1 Tax=Streptomyces sp. WAC 05379 TaxID=2203207 RepID=UPI000F73AF44|nr:NACHT domain-containing protein [Streptomyces sp. WAC 05379]RSO09912.1 hypothetical protein DMH26_00550 [Streptomyces sp. WAC 05379]